MANSAVLHPDRQLPSDVETDRFLFRSERMNEPTEPTEPIDEAQRRRVRPTWPSIALALVMVIVLVAGILELIPANDYMLLPGQALPVAGMISISGHRAPRSSGHLYMTDVSVYKVNHLLEDLYGRVNPDADLQPATSFSGGLSQKQYMTLNVELMDDSIRKAEAAALLAEGYKLRVSVSGPLVYSVMRGTPAAARIYPGDTIRAVDGHRVGLVRSVASVVRRLRPGDVARVTIVRRGRVIHVAVRTVSTRIGPAGARRKVALIGVVLLPGQERVKIPLKISINAGAISGPSAGLMFSLGIIQLLDHGKLTHGCDIAGTGTIDDRGRVGEIGGAKQKIIAARRAGARYFLVPDVPANVGPARADRGNITVVPVKTLRQALDFLKHLKPCR